MSNVFIPLGPTTWMERDALGSYFRCELINNVSNFCVNREPCGRVTKTRSAQLPRTKAPPERKNVSCYQAGCLDGTHFPDCKEFVWCVGCQARGPDQCSCS